MGQSHLCQLHVDEANWSVGQMMDTVGQLAEKLRPRGIVTLAMSPLVGSLGASTGSDGLHMGRHMKNDVSYEKATTSQFGMPKEYFRSRKGLVDSFRDSIFVYLQIR